MKTVQCLVKSEVGPLYLVASEKGLQGVYWKKQDVPVLGSLTNSGRAAKIIARATRQIGQYFRGKRKAFDLPFDIHGTPFQKLVWDELRKIPYGETCSYREIACRIKNDRAVRAVGTANGRNPLSIIVPCHRVIASSGKLGGYAGGLPIKTALLTLEKKRPT